MKSKKSVQKHKMKKYVKIMAWPQDMLSIKIVIAPVIKDIMEIIVNY